jgi:hypothetical protein
MKNLLLLLLLLPSAMFAQERFYTVSKQAPFQTETEKIRVSDIQRIVQRDSGATFVLNNLRTFEAFDSIGKIASEIGYPFIRSTETTVAYSTSASRQILVNPSYITRIDSVGANEAQLRLQSPTTTIRIAGYTSALEATKRDRAVGYSLFATLNASDTITLTGTFNLIKPDTNKTLLRIQLPANPTDGQICEFVITDTITTVAVAALGGISIINNPTAFTTSVLGSGAKYIYFKAQPAWVRID